MFIMDGKAFSITLFLLYLCATTQGGVVVVRHPRAVDDQNVTTMVPGGGDIQNSSFGSPAGSFSTSTKSPGQVPTSLGPHSGDGAQDPGSESEGNNTTEAPEHEQERFHVAKFDFKNIDTNMFIAVWIFFMCVVKCVYRKKEQVAKYFPESCALILIGVILGIILYFGKAPNYMINTHTFFYIILPPIMFDAGYFMPTRSFFDNIGTILMHAIMGTLLNALFLGFSLYGVYKAGGFGDDHDMPMLHLLTLASLLAAVDPVAVLAVFESVQVNEVLYIIVFGEALLNDGIAVVIYRIFESFSKIGQSNVIAQDIVYGCLSFLVIVIGSPGVGTILGLFTGFVTRFTGHFRLVEPLIVLVMGYISYLFAEMLHLSGILSSVFCGITMRKYVEHRISRKSQTVIKYMLHVSAQISEGIIFMYLGVSAVSDIHDWNTGFVLLTIAFCVVYRAIVVVGLNFILNMFRHKQLNVVDQFIMSYGGLRGAIAFALAFVLEPEIFYARNLYVTTTVCVVYFTNLFLGTTVEPLVAIFKIPRKDMTKLTMSSKIAERTFDHTMQGIEAIVGSTGYHHVRLRFSELNNKYVKPIIVGKGENTGTHRGHEIKHIYTKVSEKDAREMARNPSFAADITRIGSYIRRQGSTADLPRIDSSLFNPVLWGLPPSMSQVDDRYHVKNLNRDDSQDPIVQNVSNYDPAKYAKHYSQGQYSKKRNYIGSSSSQTHLADADHNDLDANTNDISVRYNKNMDDDSGVSKSPTTPDVNGNDADWHQTSAIQFVVKQNSPGAGGPPLVFVEPDKEGYDNPAFSENAKTRPADGKSPSKSSDGNNQNVPEASDSSEENSGSNQNTKSSDDKLFALFTSERNARSGSIDELGNTYSSNIPQRNKSGSIDAGVVYRSSTKKDNRE